MSEWVKAEWSDWFDDIIYLEKETGEDIVKRYKEMNNTGIIHITATQVFPLRDLPPEPPLFNAFIYYKTKIKGL